MDWTKIDWEALTEKLLKLAADYAATTETPKDDVVIKLIAFAIKTVLPVFGSAGDAPAEHGLPIELKNQALAAIDAAQA